MGRNAVHVVLVITALLSMLGASPGASSGLLPSAATVRVVTSDRSGITLELTLPDVALERVMLDGQAFDALSVPGLAPEVRAGHPDLPRKNVLLGVPPGADLHLTVESMELEMLPGNYRLAPAPRWVALSGDVADAPSGKSNPQLIEGDFSQATAQPQTSLGFRDRVPEESVQHLEPVHAPDSAIYASASPYPVELARIAHVGYARSQRVASLELVPFRYNPASSALRLVRRLRVRLAFHYPDATTRSQGTDHVEERSFEGILSRTLLNYEAARSWRAAPSLSSHLSSRSAEPWNPPEPAWKVLVNGTGLYSLSHDYLGAAGLPVDSLDPATLKLYHGGEEVAIHVTGQEDHSFDGGDSLEFYGEGLDSLYTGTNVYWLTYGGADGLRMAVRNGTPGEAPRPTAFTTTARIEENHTYWQGAPGGDHWLWERMYAVDSSHSITEPLTFTFAGTLGLVATDVPTATVGISLLGSTYNNAIIPDHHVQVFLNDLLIADAWWEGRTVYHTEVDVPQAALANITNTFRLEMPADTGSPYDGVYLNKFEVEYGHAYRAVDDELAFTQAVAGAWQYRITGFSGPEILVLDVSDPARVVRISGAVLQEHDRVFLPLVAANQTGAVAGVVPSTPAVHYALRFQDAAPAPADYLLLAPGRARQPLAIVHDTPSGLADAANQAEYVIIAPDNYYTSTLPLAGYWEAEGMAVQVVRASDVYDEFSYGILDPTAIRDFLAFAYANWQYPQLAYVLLVGDASYDYRDYRGFGSPPGIPTYLLPAPFIGETGSDNWYACVSGDDYLPDLHIGRLPAGSVAAVDQMVARILDYAQSPPPGDWKQEVLFVADNQDSAGDFAYFSDELVNGYLPPAYTPRKVYYKITHPTQPEVTAAITNTVNATGTVLINYVGHGSIVSWAHEQLLMCYGDRCDVDDLYNGGRLPFIVSMTCSDGYYIHPDPTFTSLAERWLLKNGGGGIAMYAATGLGVATGHDWMNRGLFTAIFSDNLSLGPATTASKYYMHAQTGGAYRDLVETYHLFGDPALSLNLP